MREREIEKQKGCFRGQLGKINDSYTHSKERQREETEEREREREGKKTLINGL